VFRAGTLAQSALECGPSSCLETRLAGRPSRREAHGWETTISPSPTFILTTPGARGSLVTGAYDHSPAIRGHAWRRPKRGTLFPEPEDEGHPLVGAWSVAFCQEGDKGASSLALEVSTCAFWPIRRRLSVDIRGRTQAENP
jgi:hypothetical protein